jgi:hypothetical protein
MANFLKVVVTRSKGLKILRFISHYQGLPGFHYQAKIKLGNYQLVMAGNAGNDTQIVEIYEESRYQAAW